MENIAGFLLVYIVFLGAMISPGPDFLIVLRNALGYSARAGVFTALGIAAALSIHMAYCIAGIGLLISQSIVLFNIVKWVGAGYLAYIGIQALRSRGTSVDEMTVAVEKAGMKDIKAFISGFVTNLFNPKATLFFLALFTQMIDPHTPLAIQAVFGVSVMVTAFIWFSLVALVMGLPAVRGVYARASKAIDRICGAFFIALAAKLALARQ